MTAITTQAQRRVSFYPKVAVRQLTHIHDLEQEEKDEIWFSNHEMVSIQASCRETINRMKMGLEHLEEECTRGLEGFLKKPEDKLLSQQTVIQEQNRQIEQSGCCEDDETLSREYQFFSCPSQMRAYKRAIEDRREILEGDEELTVQHSVSVVRDEPAGLVIRDTKEPARSPRSLNSRAA